MIRKKPLNSEVALALAMSGVQLDDAEAGATTALEAPAAPDAPAPEAPEAPVAPVLETAPAAPVDPTPVDPTIALNAQVTDLNTQLAVERARVSDARAERDQATTTLAAAQLQVTSLTAEAANQSTAITSLEGSLRQACERLCVALKANASDLTSLHGTALAERFQSLSNDLQKIFPTAGKARSAPVLSVVKPNEQAEPSPSVSAAVAATRSR